MESWVQSWRPHTNAFCDFPLHLSKVIIAPATKKWCQVIRSAAPVTQNHLSKPEDLRLQNATPLRKSAPGPPNISDEHVPCTAPTTENASLQILFKCPTPAIVFGNATKPSCFCSLLTWSTIPCACHAKRHLFGRGASMWRFSHFDFEMCFAPKRRALFRHRNFQKLREREVFLAVSLANVLRTTTACTFSTCQLPKNGPRPWVFNTFDFEMCFAPQRRALFQHLHLQKWSERDVLLAFSLAMCFVPQRRALFRHLNFQKVVRTWCVLHILTLEMCFAPQRRAIFHLSSGQLAPHPPL